MYGHTQARSMANSAVPWPSRFMAVLSQLVLQHSNHGVSRQTNEFQSQGSLAVIARLKCGKNNLPGACERQRLQSA